MAIVENNQIASNFSIARHAVEENPVTQSSPPSLVVVKRIDCLPARHESSIGLASSVSLTYATNWMATRSMRSD